METAEEVSANKQSDHTMLYRRKMKSTVAPNLVFGYLLLLLCVLMSGGYSRKPQGFCWSSGKSINACKQEGYKEFDGRLYIHSSAWMRSATCSMGNVLDRKYIASHSMDCMNYPEPSRIACGDRDATMIIGQWDWDGLIPSAGGLENYIGKIITGGRVAVLYCNELF